MWVLICCGFGLNWVLIDFLLRILCILVGILLLVIIVWILVEVVILVVLIFVIILLVFFLLIDFLVWIWSFLSCFMCFIKLIGRVFGLFLGFVEYNLLILVSMNN